MDDRRREYYLKITPRITYRPFFNMSNNEQIQILQELKEELLKYYNFPFKVSLDIDFTYYDEV